MIDKILSSFKYINQNNFWRYSCRTNDIKFISHIGNTIVLDKNNLKIADLKLSNPQVKENKLIDVEKQSITVIDLNELK